MRERWNALMGITGGDTGAIWQVTASVLLVIFLAVVVALLATRWRNLFDR